MKKWMIALLSVALIVSALAVVALGSAAQDYAIANLFQDGFQGYTSHEAQVLAGDFVSSKNIAVSEGDQIWFGPCDPAQYFHLVGLDGSGNAATGKVRSKDLTKGDRFNNGMYIYSYTVPAGVSQVVFTTSQELADVFTATNGEELTELKWRAYWSQMGIDPDSYVGPSSYYEVSAGDKLYFGALTAQEAASAVRYDQNGDTVGQAGESGVRLVESFGGSYGIYCYTAAAGDRFVLVPYDDSRVQYYRCYQYSSSENVTDAAVTEKYIASLGISKPLQSTVEKLSGKTALFLGDSITYGARDTANIYSCGSWAGRIGYFAGMDVTNNGVSGACISTARLESHTEGHYIYNNLKKTEGVQFDYVIMHGLFNDASMPLDAPVGTAQGKANFVPDNANVATFSGALELLFYQARVQNPNAILGYIVNFETERTNVDQAPYVAAAIAICKDWGIEYLDLFHQEGFTVEFDDGLHPSSAGYDGMYTVVADWMATLDGNPETGSVPTKVMSYNVYFGGDTLKDETFTIENRYQKVATLIKDEAPDIITFQEFTDDFWNVAEDILTEYTVWGESHTGLASGSYERANIGWKTDKYDMVISKTLWASDTPEVPYSSGWCGSEKDYPRAINLVVLQEKETGKQIGVISVHGQPDDLNEEARTKTMAMVAQLASALTSQNIGVVIGGDFNMRRSDEAYGILTDGGLTDVKQKINPNSVGTYNDWDRVESKFADGDYLFTAGSVNAVSYRVITEDLDTRNDGLTVHISDHCPIVMQIYY